MSDEPEKPPQAAAPPAAPNVDTDTAGDFMNDPSPFFRNIEAFTEIRAEAYLLQAAILTIQFVGRGDSNHGRREFLRMANVVFDQVDEDYKTRAFEKNMRRMRLRRRAAPPPAEQPPPSSEPEPDPTAG